MRPDPTAVAVRFAKKWKKLPPGWTDKSVEKFWKTLGKGTPEHKVWNCIEKMDGHIPNTGAFCGGLADWQMPGWRKKNKKESPEARSDAKSYWKGKIKKKMKGKKAMTTASAANVALRFAIRSGPPTQTGSAVMLKKQGLTPVDVWFGEAKPHRRPIIGLGDMVQDRRGKILFFAGIASDGSAILGKDEREAGRLHKQIIEDRKHHTTRAAFSGSPLMLQPDYGHGDAAVPDGRVPPCQQGYHPCQHGLPCECGGGCGGKKASKTASTSRTVSINDLDWGVVVTFRAPALKQGQSMVVAGIKKAEERFKAAVHKAIQAVTRLEGATFDDIQAQAGVWLQASPEGLIAKQDYRMMFSRDAVGKQVKPMLADTLARAGWRVVKAPTAFRQ